MKEQENVIYVAGSFCLDFLHLNMYENFTLVIKFWKHWILPYMLDLCGKILKFLPAKCFRRYGEPNHKLSKVIPIIFQHAVIKTIWTVIWYERVYMIKILSNINLFSNFTKYLANIIQLWCIMHVLQSWNSDHAIPSKRVHICLHKIQYKSQILVNQM